MTNISLRLIGLLRGLIFTIALLNSGYVNSEQGHDQSPITIALPDGHNIPPYLWYCPRISSEPRGYSPDIIRRVFKKIGVNYKMEKMSSGYPEPHYSLSLIKDHSYDAIAIPSYINTQKTVSIPEPLYSVSFTVFIRAENANDYTDISSLKDKHGLAHTIRASSDSFAQESPENFNKLDVSNDFEFILRQLVENKIDYMIASKSIGGGYLSRHEFKDKVIASDISIARSASIYLVINRKGRLANYFDEINKTIINMKSTGEFNLLLRKNMYLGLTKHHNTCVESAD